MNNKNISNKILDQWDPPQNAGDPIGCLATTFTFDAAFFEKECLGRFVKMESDPNTDGPVYLIEREEKLSGIKAAVLVDKNHCKGNRSLRWDLISFRKNNILHAKISFLHWANHIRIIIASANLTKYGYRFNQEVFGVLDFYKGGSLPEIVFEKVISYLKLLMDHSGNLSDQPEVKKWNELLDDAWNKRSFFCSEIEYKGYKEPRIYPLLMLPGKESLFDQLKSTWKRCSDTPPRKAYIISPFFDQSEPNKPAQSIWEVLSLRGHARVVYNVIEESNEEDDQVIIKAPQSLTYKPSGRTKVSVSFEKIREEEIINNKSIKRPLHMKSIWLEKDDWSLYMIGSSNFTSAGIGLHPRSNYEANLAYIVSSERNRKAYKNIYNSYPETFPIKKVDSWVNPENQDEASNNEAPILPIGFASAYFEIVNGRQVIIINLIPEKLPESFTILDERNKWLLDEHTWIKNGRNKKNLIHWGEIYLPSVLSVKWKESNGSAWWPLNVVSQSVLPVPEELKALPLETLMNILSSQRPLYHSIRKWLKTKEKDKNKKDIVNELDALKRVNTNDFLLQRTRRISYALNTLKYKLEKPLFTKETLHWRLYGPVGVKTLCDAILREARSNEEKLFLLAEIALELSEIQPTVVENSLDVKFIKKELLKLTKEIEIQARSLTKYVKVKSLKFYLNETFQKATHEL